MTCRQCGTEIATNALICYRCGSATVEPRIRPPEQPGSLFDRPRRRWARTVVMACVLSVIVAMLWFVFGAP